MSVERTQPTPRDQAHIDRVFGAGGVVEPNLWRQVLMRNEFRSLMLDAMETLPESRERSLVLTNLETAYLYAKEAIARDEPPPESRA